MAEPPKRVASSLEKGVSVRIVGRALIKADCTENSRLKVVAVQVCFAAQFPIPIQEALNEGMREIAPSQV
jgi:hypothetical protein